MSTLGATHDECMQCGALVSLRDGNGWHDHFKETGHFAYRDVIVESLQRKVLSVDGTCVQ